MTATLIDLALKATLVLVAAGAVALLLQRRSAAVRHLVWTAALTGIVVLPLGSFALPDWRVGLPSPVFTRNDVEEGRREETSRETVAPRSSATDARARPDDSPRRRSSTSSLDVAQIIGATWLAGVALLLVWLSAGLARIALLARSSRVVDDPRWLDLAARLGREAGVTRPVTLRRSWGPAMPMTWGVWRPTILLPAGADAWPADRRRDVLLHELAHIRRHDVLTQLVASIACALYWFHPLAWVAARRLRVERERACDDQVIRSGRRASDYAAHLLDVARSLTGARLAPLAAVAMARRSQLADRLLDVLDARRDRAGVSARVAAPVWVAAALVVLPLGALNRVEEERRLSSTPVLDVSRREPWSIDSLKGCDGGRSRSRSTSHNVDDHGMTISVSVGRCRVRFEVDGDVRFTPDFADVASITGGQAFLEMNDGSVVRRVDLRQRGGTLERTYTVDGDAKAYDAAARAWFTDVLTFLFRRTGMYAQERSRWILEHSGIEGLFREIAQITGDYGRRQYYEAAIESGTLDATGYERIVTQAGREIESDFELAELLVAVAQSQALTEAMQAGFASAAQSIDSDFEHHRVLSAVARRGDASKAFLRAAVASAATISSDFELAQFLVDVAEKYTVDDALRPPYFEAVKTIGSDYELSRTLRALVDGRSDAPLVREVLVAARGIDSDYELAQLLVTVAQARRIDDALRPAFVEAMNGISSGYERERVARALERSAKAELD